MLQALRRLMTGRSQNHHHQGGRGGFATPQFELLVDIRDEPISINSPFLRVQGLEGNRREWGEDFPHNAALPVLSASSEAFGVRIGPQVLESTISECKALFIIAAASKVVQAKGSKANAEDMLWKFGDLEEVAMHKGEKVSAVIAMKKASGNWMNFEFQFLL